jgi:pyrroloquinoline quinone biosynthesis protein B
MAIGTGDGRWLLLNCSPDVASQIEAFEPLQPCQKRGTPIHGMLLTDANVDHLGGLATLRQHGAHRFVVRSSAVVREVATAQPAFAPFALAPHRWISVEPGERCAPADDADPVGNDFEVRPIAVDGTTPGYDGRRNVPGAVVAYEIAPRGGRTVLFAPVFSAIDGALFDAIARAEIAILDGTFYGDDEMLASGLSDKTARSLGHQPVGGAGGTLERVHGLRTRIVFTHLNNSNSMLDPQSDAAARVREAGAEIAYDGLEIVVG